MRRRTSRNYKKSDDVKPAITYIKKEEVIPHMPVRSTSTWYYTLKEGGQKYSVNLPNTETQIEIVKQDLLNKTNWKFYIVSPYGGDRAYTIVTSFPPFDPFGVAEVHFPNGMVWRSRTRKFHKL